MSFFISQEKFFVKMMTALEIPISMNRQIYQPNVTSVDDALVDADLVISNDTLAIAASLDIDDADSTKADDAAVNADDTSTKADDAAVNADDTSAKADDAAVNLDILAHKRIASRLAKKTNPLFNEGVQIVSVKNDSDLATTVTAIYTEYKLTNIEYTIEQKHVVVSFKRYHDLGVKRNSHAEYKADSKTIFNYGMLYKKGCSCNFTRVVKALLENPTHLFRTNPIPDKLTIKYYDNNKVL